MLTTVYQDQPPNRACVLPLSSSTGAPEADGRGNGAEERDREAHRRCAPVRPILSRAIYLICGCPIGTMGCPDAQGIKTLPRLAGSGARKSMGVLG